MILVFAACAGFAARGAGRIAVAVAAGVAVSAPAVRAVYAHVTAPRADCCAVGAEVTVFALFNRFTFKAAFTAVGACSAAVAVRAGVAAEAPAVRRTFHADFAAVGTQQHAIGAGVAFRALRIGFAQRAGVVAGFADCVAVAVAAGVAVFTKAVCAVDAFFAAFFTNRCALFTGVAVIALTVFVAFHTGFAAVGAGCAAVAVTAEAAALAPAVSAVYANIHASVAQDCAVFTRKTNLALIEIAAFIAGLAAVVAGCAAVAVRAQSAVVAEFGFVRAVGARVSAVFTDVIHAILAIKAMAALIIICTAFAAGLAAAGARCISVAVAAASAAYTEFGIA